VCLLAPGLVTAIDDGMALVEVEGVTRRALTLLSPDVRAGDWVIVGAGAVIRRVPKDEARTIEEALRRATTSSAASRPSPGHPTHEHGGRS